MRLLLFFSLLSTIGFSQSLTEIKTKEQAEKFIKENFRYFDHRYDLFVIDSVESGFDTFKEGDFNHDGIKDLLVYGRAHITQERESYEESEIVVLIGDKRRPRKADFSNRYFSRWIGEIAPHPKVITIDRRDYILIQYNVSKSDFPDETRYDTLFIKDDHAIPFAMKPATKEIAAISFSTTPCFGPCPVFEMTISKNLDVEYNGIDHVKKKGEHELRIDQKDWDYLTTVISSIKIETLSNQYEVPWTDDQTGHLTVTFKDGTKKSIEDYGLRGTVGLSILYDYFFELRKF